MGRRWARLLGVTLSAAMLCLVLCGCHATEPRATTSLEVPRAGNAELVLYISDQPYVTAEAAFRAVHLLANGEPFAGDFAELRAALESQGLIGSGWGYVPEQYVKRAAIGYMLCRACRIRTGVNWNLTGLGRYAWRELQYHEIAQGGDENRLMSGGEFVGTLLRAEEYLVRAGKHDAQPVELGSPGS